MSTLFQLIAREYSRYVFTRGFLLFLLIIPAAMAFGFFSSQVTQNSTPVRAFTVLDGTGQYIPVIDAALAEDQAFQAARLWRVYTEGLKQVMPEAVDRLPDAFQLDEITTDSVGAFEDAGGLVEAQRLLETSGLTGLPPLPQPQPRFVRVPLPTEVALLETFDAQVAALKDAVDAKAPVGSPARPLFGGFVIPPDFNEVSDQFTDREATLWTSNLLDGELRSFVDQALTEYVREQTYNEVGLDAELVQAVQGINVRLRAFRVADVEVENADTFGAAATLLPIILAYILMVMIFTVGNMLLTSTIEEKSNKIIEVLLSSVSATQLMAGKLIGVALVGLTVPALFVLFGIGAWTVGTSALDPSSPLLTEIESIRAALLASPLVPLFVFYFLTGYVLFASIYLAVGALSETLQDAQTFMAPLTLLLFLPIPFLFVVVQEPNGIVAQVMTWIPLYTPFTVMIRLTATPPLWEIVGSSILFVTTVIFVLGYMGRIYRNGVLGAGGKVSWRQARDLASRG